MMADNRKELTLYISDLKNLLLQSRSDRARDLLKVALADAEADMKCFKIAD
jgi:hypothetical protein